MESDTSDTSDANDSKKSCTNEARLGKRLCESDSRLGKRLYTTEDEFGNYDVFMSHRGPDIKTGFVRFLFEALKRVGLHPFLDCISIGKGQNAWTCIDHAIKTTPLALVIFSKNFTQSEWCLKELHAMLDSPSMKVLPIFYNVQPWEVSFPEKGQLAAGFTKLTERHDIFVMEEWRADLKRASKLNGWEFKVGEKRLEADLVMEVVDKIFELTNKPLPLVVGDHIGGVKQVAKNLIQSIIEKKVLLLGLWGMRGIGKSTLARELYNQLGRRFDARCYVEDVAEMVNQGGVMIVQNHILKALCENESMENIFDKSSGMVILEERLSKKPILLVLDDVRDHDEMDYLLSRKMLKEGSICIVTSQNRRIFEKSTSFLVNHDVHIHNVQILSQEDSQSLFACHAFGGDGKVPQKFEGLVGDVSMACNGVPLVLMVCGSLLRDEEDVKIWEEVLKKLNCGTVMDKKKIFDISTTISSNLTSAELQDNSEAPSSVVLIEDNDSKSEDFMFSHHITKWIIYGDLLERTVLCFNNIEEMQYEFYFENHESMATIIGLGVPHSKVVLKCGSPHVTVVEIPKEDWDVVWAHSSAIPLSISKGNVLKQEQFPDILHCIANIIHTDKIVSKANDGGVGGDNGKGKAQDNTDDRKGKGKGKAHDHGDYGSSGHADGGSNGASDDSDKKERKGKDGNDDKNGGRDQDGKKTSNDCKEVHATVYLVLWPGGVLEEKGKEKESAKVYKREEEGEEMEFGEGHEDKKGEKMEHEEICEIEVEEGKKEGQGGEAMEKKKNKYFETLFRALTRSRNIVGNQQEWKTTNEVENGDDGSLQKQLSEQIHAEMRFTFKIKDNLAGRQRKTIQAIVDPITFQFPSNNKKNYLQRHRFGWLHKNLKVAFGVDNPNVAYLESKSFKVLDSSEVEELSLCGTSKGISRTSTNAYKGKLGFKHGIIASGEYNRTNGSEAKTTEEVQNSSKNNIRVTKGDFYISDLTNLNSRQIMYSYHPCSPFKEKEFEMIGEDDRLDMYHRNPICQSQQVSCEGTWLPYDSKKLEKYILKASRGLGMTRIYNLELETGGEKKPKGVWKVEKNLPLCFKQRLEKVVYLNHAMSHLTSSTTGEYYLRELEDLRNPPTVLTQGQEDEKPIWPSNDPLVDVKQQRNI